MRKFNLLWIIFLVCISSVLAEPIQENWGYVATTVSTWTSSQHVYLIVAPNCSSINNVYNLSNFTTMAGASYTAGQIFNLTQQHTDTPVATCTRTGDNCKFATGYLMNCTKKYYLTCNGDGGDIRQDESSVSFPAFGNKANLTGSGYGDSGSWTAQDTQARCITSFWGEEVNPNPDTTPPTQTLINLTSEGGLGQIVYQPPSIDNRVSNLVRTNDTTPTLRVNIDETGSCDLIDNRTQTLVECSGTTAITCTEATEQLFGVWNFTTNCTDSAGNRNQTEFSINFTDNIAPNVYLLSPENNAVYQAGINNTITFNFTSNDSYDVSYSCIGYIDNSAVYTNGTYLNGTVGKFVSTQGVGTHSWYVNCTDSYNNINQSEIKTFSVITKVNITLYLNGTDSNKSYEFNVTQLNKDYGIELNISVIPNQTVCLDYDYLINWTCITGNGSIRFNITKLNITKFSNGNTSINISSTLINVTINIDNQTDLGKISLKFEGYDVNGFPRNLEIDTNKDNIYDFKFPGRIKNNELEINSFLSDGNYTRKNLSYISAGSKVIEINVSSDLDIKNLTFIVNGFDLDLLNEFNYNEQFNNSAKVNETLNLQTDSPLGYFDDFESNTSGRWSGTYDISDGTVTMSYSTGKIDDSLIISGSSPSSACGNKYGDIILTYSDGSADWRNTSTVEIDTYYSLSASCGASCSSSGSASAIYYLTDGTNSVTLKEYSVSQSSTGSTSSNSRINMTLTRQSETSVGVYINGSLDSSVSIASLDASQQLKLKSKARGEMSGPCSGGAAQGSGSIDLYSIKWGGVWLNRSTNNGTYKSYGNFTSLVLNKTQTNVTTATLSWTPYTPANTGVNGYISNTCNSSNPTFESVTNGITHTFSSVGNYLCVRFFLNSTINTTSPVLRKYTLDVSPSSITNLSFDFGNDGDNEWSWLDILNLTTSPKVVNGSTNDFDCDTLPTCLLPIAITTQGGGVVEINSMNFTQYLPNSGARELTFRNITNLEDDSPLNWTFSFTDGVIKLFGLDVEYSGSKNITLFAHSVEDSSHLYSSSNHTLKVFYSKFNQSLANGRLFYNVLPSSKDSKNVTPFGQTSRTPIWNITNLAYDKPFDVYVKLNNTMNCTTGNSGSVYVTYVNSSNKTDGKIITTQFNETPILVNLSKELKGKQITNHTINITLNDILDNSTIILPLIVDEHFSIRNASSPNPLLNRNTDYKINFTTGNFTLLNSTYNITNLYATYNYSYVEKWKGIWNFWDFSNCTKRFIIPYIEFRTYCDECVR